MLSFSSLLPLLTFLAVMDVASRLVGSLIETLTQFEKQPSMFDMEKFRKYKSFLLQFALKYCVMFYATFWLKDVHRVSVEVLIQVLVLASVDVAIQIYRNTVTASRKCNRDDEGEDFNVDNEYLDLVIQYGFVSMFSFTSPWICIVAFLKTMLVAKVLAFKKLNRSKRPIAAQPPLPLPWTSCLEMMSILSVFTNCFYICYLNPHTLNMISSTGLGSCAAFLALEHIMFAIKALLYCNVEELPLGIRMSLHKSGTKVKDRTIQWLAGSPAKHSEVPFHKEVVRRLDMLDSADAGGSSQKGHGSDDSEACVLCTVS